MNLKGKTIGFIITGSFYAFRKTIDELKTLKKLETNIIPIMSETAYNVDTKYGKAKDFIKEIEHITNHKVLHTIEDIENLENQNMLDILVVAPATSNTIAKIANNISDTPVTIVIKHYLRREKSIVIAIACHDGLSTGAENIGKILNKKNFYFVPFKQSNPVTKPCSIVFDPKYLKKTIEYALDGEQLQPMLI